MTIVPMTGDTPAAPGVGDRDERRLTDQQLRRRYRLVRDLLAIPGDEVEDLDLWLHSSAIEAEAARRGLDLHEEPPPIRRHHRLLGLLYQDWLALLALAAFAGMLWAALW